MSHDARLTHDDERRSGHFRSKSDSSVTPRSATQSPKPSDALVTTVSNVIPDGRVTVPSARRVKHQNTTDSEASAEILIKTKPVSVEVSTTSLAYYVVSKSSDRPHKIYWPAEASVNFERLEVCPNSSPEHALQCLKKSWNLKCSGRRGAIFIAVFQTEDGQPEHVAVKITHCKHLKIEEAKEEFRQLCGIEHCHIVAALDMFKHDQQNNTCNLYLLLYPLARTDLHDHLEELSQHNERRSNTLDPTQWRPHKDAYRLLEYLPCLSQAVIYLHTLPRPIKHRDIKPANILIDKYDGVLLADFDISRQYPPGKSSATHGLTEMTINYAPLHVQDPKKKRDLEWDVISLAFVFAEMLTVALGESRHNMFDFMNGDVQRDKDTEVETNFGKACSNGKLQQWLDFLLTIPEKSPNQIPSDLNTSILKDAVDHISAMMRCPPESGLAATRVLDKAYACFARMAQPCPYCGRESGREVRCGPTSRIGGMLAPPVERPRSVPPTISMADSWRISTISEAVDERDSSTAPEQQSSRTSLDSFHDAAASVDQRDYQRPLRPSSPLNPSASGSAQASSPLGRHIAGTSAMMPNQRTNGSFAPSFKGISSRPSTPKKEVRIAEPDVSSGDRQNAHFEGNPGTILNLRRAGNDLEQPGVDHHLLSSDPSTPAPEQSTSITEQHNHVPETVIPGIQLFAVPPPPQVIQAHTAAHDAPTNASQSEKSTAPVLPSPSQARPSRDTSALVADKPLDTGNTGLLESGYPTASPAPESALQNRSRSQERHRQGARSQRTGPRRQPGEFTMVSTKGDYYAQMNFEKFRGLAGPYVLEYKTTIAKNAFSLTRVNTEDLQDFNAKGVHGVFYKFDKRNEPLHLPDGQLLDLPRCLGWTHQLLSLLMPVKVLYYACREKRDFDLILEPLERKPMSW